MESQHLVEYKIHDLESAPKDALPLLEKSKRSRGRIANIQGVMANLPGLLGAYQDMDAIFREKALFDSHEQEVILLAINVMNQCHYCVAVHSVVADYVKVPKEVTQAIGESRPIPDHKLEGLRRFTETMLQKEDGWTMRILPNFWPWAIPKNMSWAS